MRNEMTATISGSAVKGMMRAHKRTIRGLAASMGVTQRRVRQVRSAGVFGALKARDWVEAITGFDPGTFEYLVLRQK